MDLIDGIETRRSCRAYKPDPVPEETIRKILETAKWSPSFSDSQPWEVAVVSGKKKDELLKVLAGLARRISRAVKVKSVNCEDSFAKT